MDEATLTSKSQLTLPKAVRDSLGVGPGDKVRFVPSLSGFRIVAMTGDVRNVRGLFKGRNMAPVSIAEMDSGITQAVQQRQGNSSGMVLLR